MIFFVSLSFQSANTCTSSTGVSNFALACNNAFISSIPKPKISKGTNLVNYSILCNHNDCFNRSRRTLTSLPTSKLVSKSKGMRLKCDNRDDNEKDNDQEYETNLYVQDDNEDNKKIRYRGRVAYDGSNFKGWQVQAKGRTVQGELEKILSQRFNREIKIVGAGRTDAGVHARGQAFQFDIYPHEIVVKQQQQAQKKRTKDADENDFDHDRNDENDEKLQVEKLFREMLQTSLNSMLPQDIRIWDITKSPPPALITKTIPIISSQDSDNENKEEETTTITKRYNWHVIYNAIKKLYVYRISIGPKSISTDPLQRYHRVYFDGDVDLNQLERVLKYYEGTHDFRAFAGAVEANQRKDGVEHKNTVRTIYNVTLVDEGNGNYRIDILLQGALYKMVRNMVGTALDVCRGRVDEEYMLQILHHSDEDDTSCENGNKINSNDNSSKRSGKQFVRNDNKCKPAPPEGLTLEKVYFDDEF